MNLNLMTTFFPSGYGIAGYHIFKNLHDRGVNISLFLEGDQGVPWVDLNAVHAARQNAVFYDDRAACLKIHHQFVLAERVGRGKFIAYSFFELDPLAPKDVHHMNRTDMMLVASQWAHDLCRRSGVTVPISVVPLGVDPAVFCPTAPQPAGPQPAAPRPCVFLNVGKWEVRKGHEVLIHAFNHCFSEADHVELWMMTEYLELPPEDKQRWHKLYLDSKLGRAGKIKILPPVASHVELAGIMRSASCGVFPSLAEGFNLELLETMACGRPVIATNYSAHTEYCNPANALLIETPRLVPAYDGRWHFGQQGNWAAWEHSQTDQLCDYLRHVYQLHAHGDVVNHGGIETGRKLTWDNTTTRIMQAALS